MSLMLIKVGDFVFDPNLEPVALLNLTDQDKKNIEAMASGAKNLCEHDDKLDVEDVQAWMDKPGTIVNSDELIRRSEMDQHTLAATQARLAGRQQPSPPSEELRLVTGD